ncbi:MAG: NAD(P)-binding domain-containing protein, partial [Bacteroidales bacterium]|nr:NAD(P)-binding domain-containing protein [Bacteroidales bacterium]
MRAESINKISFIGAGNVASHLAMSFNKAGFTITDVWSESVKSAKILAEKVNANWCYRADEMTSNCDLLVMAIPDRLIEEVGRSLNIVENQMLVHTSGTVQLKALAPFAENHGVFYPLQTFSRDRPIEFKTIPVLVEANSINNLNMLSDVASRISDKVVKINSEKRKYIHLAAVFV